jgi:hypothetical protein
MRRILGSVFGMFLLFGCSDLTESPMGNGPGSSGTATVSTVSHVFDGGSGAEGANPHFFFLSPLVQNPVYSGVADDGLSPVVTVCNIEVWDAGTETCPSPVAVFSMDDPDADDKVFLDPGVKYYASWKTSRYPAPEGETFRISVSVLGKVLGWIDVTSYPQSVFASFQGTDPEGNVAISSNGTLNITFRIEDGALESAFCDRDGIEDCDVLILNHETGGTLRVYEAPETSGGPLGSKVDVPAGGLLNGDPIQGPYAVILQLEQDGTFQPGTVPADQQVPYFVDLRTEPPGVTFDRGGEGVNIVLCQVVEGVGAIDEELHPFLTIFLTRTSSTGQSTTLLPTTFGTDECGNLDSPFHARAQVGVGSDRWLGRFSAGLSRISGFLLPRPLLARRLHGGLNTVVWEISGDDGGDGDNGDLAGVSGLTFALTASGEGVLEFGAVLDVDPDLSNATVTITDPAVVGSETEIYVQILNAAGEPFPFEVDVTVEVTGANTGSLLAEYLGNGMYRAAYTPSNSGTDTLVITAYREGILPTTEIGTFTSEVHPLSGDLVVVVEIEGSAPADGLPVYLYQGAGADPFLTSTTGPDGAATFVDIEFGDYTVHLPKRDFDVQFATMTQTVSHQSAPSTVTFTGATQALPAGVQVYRIKDGGNGNAFRYVLDNQSWVSSEKKAQDLVLLGVSAHLATIHSPGENEFVAARVREVCGSDLSKCKSQGWIGLNDDAIEGTYVWVTGEEFTYSSWDTGQPSTKNNHDHVEINPFGKWSTVNGASSTNDGYVAEWPVTWPPTPPF